VTLLERVQDVDAFLEAGNVEHAVLLPGVDADLFDAGG
jgi:hypothetical protein